MKSGSPWYALYDPGLGPSLSLRSHTALEMFSASLARYPDADLLRYFDTSMTFRQADEMSGAIACGLAEHGIGRGDRLGVYLQNGPAFVLALVGAWKLGAIAVLCNPMMRQRELATELRDSGAVALIALESLYEAVASEVLPDTDVRVVVTTSELDFLEGTPPEALRHVVRRGVTGALDLVELTREYAGSQPFALPPDPADVAVLTYTSGTTGPPKGAMNTHLNLAFSSQVFHDWLHVDRGDVILGIAPMFHVTGLIANAGLSMSAGIPVVLADRFDAEETCRLVERHAATICVASITAYLALLESPALALCDVSSLRKAYSGGAPVPPAVLTRFEARCGIILRPAYGLTETTSSTHLTPLARRAPIDEETGIIAAGVPVFDTQVRILGRDGTELPRDMVGEIALRGPQVVPGYWDRPEESAETIPDGELLSGDLGKVDPDGWLYVLDRRKDLIIASGYKVWPQEVEDVLYEHPSVREAAVVGVPDSYRGETVRAYVSVQEGEVVTSEELIEFCRQRLSAYKYPREVRFLSELPKTVSGKILRRELRALT